MYGLSDAFVFIHYLKYLFYCHILIKVCHSITYN